MAALCRNCGCRIVHHVYKNGLKVLYLNSEVFRGAVVSRPNALCLECQQCVKPETEAGHDV